MFERARPVDLRRVPRRRRAWSPRRCSASPRPCCWRSCAASRSCSCSGLLQPGGAGVAGVTIALFGLVWIGLGLRPRGAAARVAARRRDRRARPRRDVHRRQRRLLRRPRDRAPAAGAGDLAEQDGRGPAHRHRRGDRRRLVRRALPGLAERHRRAAARRRRGADRAARRPVRELRQARGRARRTPVASSAPTAGRSTASTPCCSRSSPATTSGRRCSRPQRSVRTGAQPASAHRPRSVWLATRSGMTRRVAAAGAAGEQVAGLAEDAHDVAGAQQRGGPAPRCCSSVTARGPPGSWRHVRSWWRKPEQQLPRSRARSRDDE